MFFFSSRRRHTRWTGDWSSDVCSSDLGKADGADHERKTHDGRGERRAGPAKREHDAEPSVEHASDWTVLAEQHQQREARSEERRVGKESRPGCEREESKRKRTSDENGE